ncbi:hypothetical protein HY631_04245 [Candidatus Uhrbacteria bacterium]|nr:hypothetical protein [Candidatus Uhrbacteria bacterium]
MKTCVAPARRFEAMCSACLSGEQTQCHLLWGKEDILLGYAHQGTSACPYVGTILKERYVRVVWMDHLLYPSKTTERVVDVESGSFEDRALLDARGGGYAIPLPEVSVVVRRVDMKDSMPLAQIGDGPLFAEIPRETMRFVDGELRYVGWLTSDTIDERKVHLGPVLVHGQSVRPLAKDEYDVNVLQDGDALAVLTHRLTKVR